MPVDLPELERLDRAATPGPWRQEGCSVAIPRTTSGRYSNDIVCRCPGGSNAPQRADAALIAYLRNALPAIVAELKAAREAKAAPPSAPGGGA